MLYKARVRDGSGSPHRFRGAAIADSPTRRGGPARHGGARPNSTCGDTSELHFRVRDIRIPQSAHVLWKLRAVRERAV